MQRYDHRWSSNHKHNEKGILVLTHIPVTFYVNHFFGIVCSQLENEKQIKNETIWALKEYYENYTLHHNVTENIPPPMTSPADVIRGPCWETEVGIVGTVSTHITICKLVSNSHCLTLFSMESS